MSTAYGIALTDKSAIRLACEAQVEPGHDLLKIEGQFTREVHNVVICTFQAITALEAETGVRLSAFDGYDLTVGLYGTANAVISGESYGLPLSLAILGAVLRRRLSPTTAFTGVILPSGTIAPVDGIDNKRRFAARLGFTKIVLPSSQLDLDTTFIDQVPVDNLTAALAGNFWEK